MPKKGQQRVKFIYGLVDPRDRRVRYVGQTNDVEERLRCHTKYASAISREGQKAKGRWTQALLAEGLRPQIVVLEVVPFAVADTAERRWIAFGAKLGWYLFNVTINPRQLDLLADVELRNVSAA
jgi:hypothetical protein